MIGKMIMLSWNPGPLAGEEDQRASRKVIDLCDNDADNLLAILDAMIIFTLSTDNHSCFILTYDVLCWINNERNSGFGWEVRTIEQCDIVLPGR